MRNLLLMVVGLSLVGASARAEPPVPTIPAAGADAVRAGRSVAARADTAEPRLAVAFNGPHSWTASAFGASAYVRLASHVALRGNLASYSATSPVVEIIGELSGGDASAKSGRVLDLGLAAMWFPMRTWQGPFLEAGVLRRARESRIAEYAEDTSATRTTEYAARAMLGWSWLVGGRALIAIGVGLSEGQEVGHTTVMPELGGAPTTSRVREHRIEAETYLRFGLAFGE